MMIDASNVPSNGKDRERDDYLMDAESFGFLGRLADLPFLSGPKAENSKGQSYRHQLPSVTSSRSFDNDF